MYLRQRGLSVCERRKRDDDACPGKIEDHYERGRKIAWAHWAKELNYLTFSHFRLPLLRLNSIEASTCELNIRGNPLHVNIRNGYDVGTETGRGLSMGHCSKDINSLASNYVIYKNQSVGISMHDLSITGTIGRTCSSCTAPDQSITHRHFFIPANRRSDQRFSLIADVATPAHNSSLTLSPAFCPASPARWVAVVAPSLT